jgi:hypothetical protein
VSYRLAPQPEQYLARHSCFHFVPATSLLEFSDAPRDSRRGGRLLIMGVTSFQEAVSQRETFGKGAAYATIIDIGKPSTYRVSGNPWSLPT